MLGSGRNELKDKRDRISHHYEGVIVGVTMKEINRLKKKKEINKRYGEITRKEGAV